MKVRKKIKILTKLDLNAIEERFKKYGNQKRNFLITLTIVILAAFLVGNLYSNPDATKNKYGYINFYPKNTNFYIEVTPSDMHRYNFGAPIWWQILLKNIMMNGNTKISYGSWKMADKKIAKMLIFPMTNKILIQKSLELFSGEQSKSSTYKGFKIYKYNKRGLFLFLSNKDAFISDNFNTIKDFIDNLNSGLKHNFLSNKSTKEALKYTNRQNNDFLILKEHDRLFNQLNDLSNNKFNFLLNFYKKNPEFIKMSVASIKNTNDLSAIKSYTFLNESAVNDTKTKKTIFKKVLQENSTKLNLDFLPKETICFISGNNFGYLFDLFLNLNDSKNNEIKSFKKFIQEFTQLDYEKELIDVLNNNLTVVLLPDSSDKLSLTGILPNNKNTVKVLSGLVKLISLQAPNAEFSKINYKKIELDMVTINEKITPLVFGEIKEDLYVFGEKNAVETLIDSSINKNSPEFEGLKYYKDFVFEYPKIYFYLDNKKAKKYDRLKSITKKLPDHFRNNIQEVVYTTTTEDNKIKNILLLRTNN